MAKPEGVRITRANGDVVNCELAHLGLNDEGMDTWAVCGVQFQPGKDKLSIGLLPQKTAIEFMAQALPDQHMRATWREDGVWRSAQLGKDRVLRLKDHPNDDDPPRT